MELNRGYAHTAQLQFFFPKEDMGKIDLSKFSRPNNQEGMYVCDGGGFKTTLRFISENQVKTTIIADMYQISNSSFVYEANSLMIYDKINNYLNRMFKRVINETKLERIDLSYDVVMMPEEKALLFDILRNKAPEVVNQYTRNAEYDTTIYYNANRRRKQTYDNDTKKKWQRPLSRIIKIYDKEAQSPGKDEYKDVVRFELTLNPRSLSYNKDRYRINKTLIAYLDTNKAIYFLAGELRKILYQSDFLRLDEAIHKILQQNFTREKEDKLIKFLKQLNKKGITSVLKKIELNDTSQNNASIENTINRYKFNSYIKALKDLAINPITLDNDSDIRFLKNPILLLTEHKENKLYKGGVK